MNWTPNRWPTSTLAASLPSVTPPQPPSQFSEQLPVSPPGSPYYFLGEASPYTQSVAAPSVPENRIVAQSFGLPGQGELLALLADIGSERKSADFDGRPQQVFYSPASDFSRLARSTASQVNSGSLRPKCP